MRILKTNSTSFRGVFSRDTLPSTINGLLVCNTDPHGKPGEHWIAMCINDDGHGEYFDSFERPPTKVFKDYGKQ